MLRKYLFFNYEVATCPIRNVGTNAGYTFADLRDYFPATSSLTQSILPATSAPAGAT